MFKKLLVLSLSLTLSLILLLAAEALAYRQWHRQLLSRPPIYRADPVLGFRLKPNYQGIHQALGSHQPITITTTNQGFRANQVYTHTKPANTFRILVLGDSFVEGDEVDLPQTFTKQLEQQLNRRQDGITYQIINAGWRGSSTLQHYLWLKTEGFKFNPDLVILNFYAGNDITEAGLFDIQFDSQGLAEKLTLKNTHIDPAGFLKPNHVGHCDLFYFCQVYLRPIKDSFLTSPADFSESLWQLTQKHILAIRDLVQARDSKFLLSFAPAVQPDASPHQKLIDFAANANIAFVDLWPQFRQHQSDRLYFFRDPHWTAAGHQLTSQLILQALKSYQFIPGSGYSFLVAGHAYGNPRDFILGLYPKFLRHLKQRLTPDVKFIIFTGDIIHDKYQPESWPRVMGQLQDLNLPHYFVMGNHDFDQTAERIFTQKFGGTYYRFDVNQDRFIVLNTQIQPYSISPDQLEFLNQSLQGNFGRVFIFFHELLWNSRPEYRHILANTASRYANFELRQSNFWTQVYPLLQTYPDKLIYLFAGDIGGQTDSLPAFYQNLGNITLVASGMGGIADENYLKVTVADQVNLQLIPLNLNHQIRSLEYYTLENLSRCYNIYSCLLRILKSIWISLPSPWPSGEPSKLGLYIKRSVVLATSSPSLT